jgi:hypothetical protein
MDRTGSTNTVKMKVYTFELQILKGRNYLGNSMIAVK